MEKSMSFETYLESERLTLKYFTQNDASLLLELDSDPEVMRFLTDGKPSSQEQVKATLDTILGYYNRYDRRLGCWAAFEKPAAEPTARPESDTAGRFIGWFHLRPDKKHLDNVSELEVGYRLKLKFWGKGYATEMSLKLIEKAFVELQAEKVFAVAMKANEASVAVMRKLGMKHVAFFDYPEFLGADKSAVRYGIARGEWSKARGRSNI
jgi:RimJ/RimL family protein N-acetyltransferase